MPDEAAKRDDNGTPTLLFVNENNEIREVSPTNPLPTADSGGGVAAPPLITKTLEISEGDGPTVMVTPAAGKKLIVKSVGIFYEPGSAGEATLFFQNSGTLIMRLYRGDTGSFFLMCLPGAVDEPVIAQVTNTGAANRGFFVVNYTEE